MDETYDQFFIQGFEPVMIALKFHQLFCSLLSYVTQNPLKKQILTCYLSITFLFFNQISNTSISSGKR